MKEFLLMRRNSLDMHALKRFHFEIAYMLNEIESSWIFDVKNDSDISSSNFLPNGDSLNFSEKVATET